MMIDQTVALITGASQGIGRALAVKFAGEGMAVALTARNTANLEETARIIRENGGSEPLLIPADLRDAEKIPLIADSVLKTWGRLDVLVNNAGILHLKPFLELSLAEFEEMWEVNMRAVFVLTRAVLPHMIGRRSGTIVNISSLAGKNGFKTGTGYGATKFAVRGFAMSLMQEVREHNVRVITVFPGSVNTAMISRSPNPPKKENMIQPEDLAGVVYSAVAVSPGSMVSEIDIRPTNPRG